MTIVACRGLKAELLVEKMLWSAHKEEEDVDNEFSQIVESY